MDAIKKEAIRYLGYGAHEVDESTSACIDECFIELQEVSSCRHIYNIFPLVVKGKLVTMEALHVESKSLADNLRGCEHCFLFAATLGSEVDRLMRRYQSTQVSKATVLQACATAYLEDYLDKVSVMMWKSEEMDYPRCELYPRFSPGYGDFDLSKQGELVQLMDATRRLGLSLTKGGMLVPLKSITAVIGIGPIRKEQHEVV